MPGNIANLSLEIALYKSPVKTRKISNKKHLATALLVFILVIFGFFAPISVKQNSGQAEEYYSTFVTPEEIAPSEPEIFMQFPVSPAPADRYILVSLAEQKLQAYENGERVSETIISSGAPARPTPKGAFAIKNKYPRAYSRVARLYMPYWMAFTHDGQYWLGFHELPEWPNGAKEGEEHLGEPYSGGCIRLGVGPAEALYNWARVGDKVVVY